LDKDISKKMDAVLKLTKDKILFIIDVLAENILGGNQKLKNL
jgi:hypothetical protein